MYEFECDIYKSRANEVKHSVSFEEAVTVFGDPLAIYFDDDEHSIGENRGIIIGNSMKDRLLLVVYIETDVKIRIISSRLLTKKEKKDYENKE